MQLAVILTALSSSLPLIFVIEPVDEETANGSSVTLQCVAEAFPSPEYQWARTDGVSIREILVTGEGSFVLSPVIYGDEGYYYCNASSRDEVAHSQDVTLTGEAQENVVWILLIYSNQTIKRVWKL